MTKTEINPQPPGADRAGSVVATCRHGTGIMGNCGTPWQQTLSAETAASCVPTHVGKSLRQNPRLQLAYAVAIQAVPGESYFKTRFLEICLKAFLTVYI